MTKHLECRRFTLPNAYAEMKEEGVPQEVKKQMLDMPPVTLSRATPQSAGLDIVYTSQQPGYILFPSTGFPRLIKFPTGIYWKDSAPKRMYALLKLRSSAWYSGCFNAHLGLVDRDYPGQFMLGLSLICTDKQHTFFPKVIDGAMPTYVAHTMPERAIAQIILDEQSEACFDDEDSAKQQERNPDGFGSTDLLPEPIAAKRGRIP